MRKRRFLLISISAVLAAVLAVVLACVLISRRYYVYCQSFMGGRGGLSCFELGEKYGTSGKELPSLLFEIKAKREAGEAVSKEEYRRLFEAQVFEADREDIGGNNGLACGYWGYVAWDLPAAAEKFVRRHELVHILGIRNEFQANKEAVLEYPLGGIQTGVITAWRTLSAPDRPLVCRVVLLWARFKEYCLPWSWEPPIIIF